MAQAETEAANLGGDGVISGFREDSATERARECGRIAPVPEGQSEDVPQGVSDIPNLAGAMRFASSHIRICVMREARPSPSRGISTMCMRDLQRFPEPIPRNYCPSVSFS
jgi:hypothetical protein